MNKLELAVEKYNFIHDLLPPEEFYNFPVLCFGHKDILVMDMSEHMKDPSQPLMRTYSLSAEAEVIALINKITKRLTIKNDSN